MSANAYSANGFCTLGLLVKMLMVMKENLKKLPPASHTNANHNNANANTQILVCIGVSSRKPLPQR